MTIVLKVSFIHLKHTHTVRLDVWTWFWFVNTLVVLNDQMVLCPTEPTRFSEHDISVQLDPVFCPREDVETLVLNRKVQFEGRVQTLTGETR